MPDDPVAPPQLTYARRRREAYWRLPVRVLVRTILVVALVHPAVHYGPDLWREAKQFFWRRQTLSYAPPPGQVACDETARWGGQEGAFLGNTPDPECLTRAAGRDARGPPSVVSAILRGRTIFLHARTTPGGITRRVLLTRRTPFLRESWDAPVAFDVELTEPRLLPFLEWRSTFAHAPEVLPQVYDGGPPRLAVRIFAGVPDPADRSHFTVDFVADGVPGVMDGYLRDPKPGETEPWVELKVR
ncbi:MAG TPA: hypothetical protein VF796_13585 [Humisphaera sp.]